MKQNPNRMRVAALILSLALVLTGGCLFDDLTVFTESGENGLFVSFSIGGVNVSECEEISPSIFSCDILGIFGELQVLSTPELLGLLILLDPLVIQMPDDATNFQGSFSHSSGGDDLLITPGLSTVAVDENRSLNAEPGTQLVTIELPPGAPTSGNFDFNLNFTLPPGTTEVVARPLFTGRVELTDGSIFYAPIYPCVSQMSQVPELVIPLPAPGDTVAVPAASQGLACDGEVYEYGEATPPVPAVGLAALLTLSTLLLVSGAIRTRA